VNDNQEGGLPETVATIGVFDGVHLGHQALVHQVISQAARLSAWSVCVTFTPHPEDVLRPQTEIAHLATLEDRLALLKSLGVSEVAVLEFTPALSRLSPEEFIDLLLARFKLRQLWIGSDFALGRNRSGSPERLAEIGREKGFTVHQFPPVVIEGQAVSSSRIRQALAGGHVEEAGRLLGRLYKLTGTVVEGDHRGVTLGFPTANLSMRERLCLPADGIYAVWVRIGDEEDAHPGAASIGLRPTFGPGERRIEVYLIGFDGDLYGSELSMELVARLRGEERFDSARALTAQMIEDVKAAKAILGKED
jgi:riboflavin kinase / FMN adenylyltransferase